ncbi:MAG TPA: MBL fold metallo-hydrolase [Saprospiraceae bacterium]|nr:MBL fold metallo-hydrolase [Saprospiraceae bacterium]
MNHIRVFTAEAERFKLDGGAMFGVVPKAIWNRLNPSDEQNLCTWTMRSLLIVESNRKIIIDTGIGNKQGDRFRSFFHPHGDDLSTSLIKIGYDPGEITDVIITHFHFDHVGGALILDKKNKIVPTFPNATYWTNDIHYQWAYDPNPREKDSFLKENFVPLKEMGILKSIDVQQGVQFTDAISIYFYDGHTEAMMVPHVKLPNGKTLVYATDLLPSAHHVKMPYIMAYDIRPLVTLKEKEIFYEIVANEDHFIFFEHDKDNECGMIQISNGGKVEVVNRGDLNSYVYDKIG